MSKVSRSVLKNLVKECLVEILAEGLVGANNQIQESKRVAAKKKPVPKKRKVVKEVKEAIPETVRGVTDDPLMQSIFADTARTTLREQSEADRRNVVPMDAAARMADAADPTDVFAEAAANWATLAFSDKKLPGQHK